MPRWRCVRSFTSRPIYPGERTRDTNRTGSCRYASRRISSHWNDGNNTLRNTWANREGPGRRHPSSLGVLPHLHDCYQANHCLYLFVQFSYIVVWSYLTVHVMQSLIKPYGGLEVYLDAILILTPDRGRWSTSRPEPFIS
jgi:hypothetical protein